MSHERTICERAARLGGQVLLEHLGRFQARYKGPADLVTDADLAAQQAIQELLAQHFPDHGFVGEEGPRAAEPLAEYCWVVDPLDGTTNYAHGIPHYATSVALVHQGQSLVGAVFDPMLDECFVAQRGQGATLNGNQLRTSQVAEFSEALVAASFPHRVDKQLPAIDEFVRVLPKCQAVRRGGSAALNLAYLAAGRYDVCWASDVKAWDVAAGCLLVIEAGGQLTARDGGAFDLWNPKFVAAAGPTIHRQMMALLDSPE